MKYTFISAFIFLSLVNIIYTTKEIKNILLFVFPGGKSHNFVFLELLAYSQRRLQEENKNFDIKLHVLVHNFDKNLWINAPYEILGYGNKDSYEDQFYLAMENAKNDPVFGYQNFNKAMIHLYKDFLTDEVMLILQKTKFDLLLNDIPNFLSIYLADVLKIEKKIYVNPTCIYTWLNEIIEYNASYHPVIGTPFIEVMNFFERFTNQLFLLGTRFMYSYFKEIQSIVFRDHGYYKAISPVPKDAFFINQCVDGVHYAISLPPNVISSGAILPKPSKPLTDEALINFLNKYPRNVYISQGTVTKVLRLDILRDVLNSFHQIGFVLSLRKEFLDENTSIGFNDNVLLKSWVPQNDLLGHPKIDAFITHGGLNSILESLYHAKPMIVIGSSIDQVNGAALVDYRKYGIGITSNSFINKKNMVEAIQKILENPEYKQNCLVASNYVKQTDGKETFFYWLIYILENGYDHLVPSFTHYNYLELYNIDVGLIILFMTYLLYKFGWLIITQIYNYLCFKKSS